VPPKVKSALKADWEGNCQYSFPACYSIRHLCCLSRGCFAGLPECRFSIPAPESHRSVISLSLLTQEVLAKSYPIQPVIQL